MIAIIGCGPYGLSLASYLQRLGLEYRLIGEPLATWRHTMPPAVLMRSHLSLSCPDNPDGAGMLQDWLRNHTPGHAEDDRVRLPTHTFLGFMAHFIHHHGLASADFGRRARRVAPAIGGGFSIDLDDGSRFNADRVVMATGLTGAERLPAWADAAPPGVVLHSSALPAHPVRVGGRYLVVGGAQSAAEAVEHLLDQGAGTVTWTVRRPELNWNSVHLAATPERWARMLHLRRIFPHCSEAYRHAHYASLLPPSVEPDLRAVAARCPPRTGLALEALRAGGDGAEACFQDGQHLAVDHVVSCTGYRPALAALPLELAVDLARHDDLPLLSAQAESSLPGLFFAGAHAALRFGPQANFIFGTAAVTPAIITGLLQQ